jgi:hypothetical protein
MLNDEGREKRLVNMRQTVELLAITRGPGLFSVLGERRALRAHSHENRPGPKEAVNCCQQCLQRGAHRPVRSSVAQKRKGKNTSLFGS